jgi:hypothetical protein
MDENLNTLLFEQIARSFFQAKALSMKPSIAVPSYSAVKQLFFIDNTYVDERAKVLENFAQLTHLTYVTNNITLDDVYKKQLIYFSPEGIDALITDKEEFAQKFMTSSESNEIQVFYGVDHAYFQKFTSEEKYLL